MPAPCVVHASCVALDGHAVLITGASGSGKSTLALELMALGADLVSDDSTELTVIDGVLLARAAAAIRGRIEARGVGLLQAAAVGPCTVSLAVDLDQAESDRLPPRRTAVFCGIPVPVIHGAKHPGLAPAVILYLKGGRAD